MNEYVKGSSLGPGLRDVDCGSTEHPAMAIFREYCRVKVEFDSFCRSVAENQKGKDATEKHLAELSEKILAIVENGQHDPTVPRPSPVGQIAKQSVRY